MNVGANTITVLTTAQDGSTHKTYTITVTRAAPDPTAELVISGLAASSTLNASSTFTVTAKNSSGATTPAYVGTVTPTSSDSSVVFTPTSHTFVSGDAGAYTFSIQLNTVGAQTVTVSDGSFTKTGNSTVLYSCATGGYSAFVSTGADQSFTPASSACSSVTARLWGAGGGDWGASYPGGGGGYAIGSLNGLAYGTNYTVIVGASTGSYGGGATAPNNTTFFGGGRTAIAISGNDIMTAGGGGSGAAGAAGAGGAGGGGGLNGGNGGMSANSNGGPGNGATTTAGGTSGGGNPGTQYQGGAGLDYGAGGGGGYFGGGGTYPYAAGYPGAGGGSGYLGGASGITVTAGPSNASGSGATVGNSTDPHIAGLSIGNGQGGGTAGNGYAVLYWGASVTGTNNSGTILTLTGFNFTLHTTVTVGEKACTSVNLVSTTPAGDQITCTVDGSETANGTNSAVVTVPGYNAYTFNNAY